MRCGEKSHKWWECPHEKPVLLRNIMISSAKHQRDASPATEEPPAKRAVSSDYRTTNSLVSMIILPNSRNNEMTVITDGEESDIDIDD